MDEPAVIDPDALDRLEEWGGSDLILQLVQIFLEHAPQRVAQIRRGFDADGLEEAERGAHSLKASAGNLGARRLESLAGRIEEGVSAGEPEAARDLVDELEAAFGEACEALERLREGMAE